MSQRGQYTQKVIEHGETVWRCLELNPGGLTMNDLVELSEMTRAQIRKALEYIRDIFAGQAEQPIVYLAGRHRGVYKLNTQPIESGDDLRRRIATWMLQIKRARTAVVKPSMAKFGEDEPIRSTTLSRINRDMGRLEGDLNDLLIELNGIGA